MAIVASSVLHTLGKTDSLPDFVRPKRLVNSPHFAEAALEPFITDINHNYLKRLTGARRQSCFRLHHPSTDDLFPEFSLKLVGKP